MIFATAGCSTSAAPVSLPPLTMFSRPRGTISLTSSPKRSTVSGEVGGGLSTTLLPASRAGATLLNERYNGAFHGEMAATTPSGLRCSSTRLLASSCMTSTSSACPA
ncbi:hypothetical protein D3C85_1662330 [compost metagenome]